MGLRWLLAIALGLGACRPRVLYPDVASAKPTIPVVQLRRTDVIYPIGEHYFFVGFDPGEGEWHRNELLSRPRQGHRVSIDRIPPDASFDTRMLRPARIVREYRGPRARRILEVLQTSQAIYPEDQRYKLMGPNSNSYIAWVLRRARVGHDFNTRAVGRRFPSRVGLSDSRTGVALHTPVVGLELGLTDGVELTVGPATFGIDLVPPALLTPIGRIGVPQPQLRVGAKPQDRRQKLRAWEAEIRERTQDQTKLSRRDYRRWVRRAAIQRLRYGE